ncbi:peptidoglycan DD-metalloendopeptidase family protein [Metabacillus sp. BG109]|uniref:Peptidoglycan DD-metalloendopeptidase family protein n=2 Tax=Metabacillus bambusae TaxID=2795218 RepID=A0ABS3N0B4_9BACI|nr:peptidoglycan DD-metalloendopeptidase family protein [Metabacillus bambusae]
MKRKIVTFSLAAIIGTSGLFLPYNNLALAETLDEKKKEIDSKQSDVSNSLDEKESEITNLEKEQEQLNADIEKIDMQVAETNGEIREKEASIEETKKKIEELKAEIEVVKARIAERNKLLEERARALQESGGMVSYLDVLLGAQSFGDFVGRVSAVTTIVEADREILKAHEEDKQLLEQAEADLNSQLQSLEQSLTELEGLKEQLSAQVKQKQELMKKVELQHGEAVHEYHELENEAEFLAQQEKAILQEQQRQKEAAEAAARAAAEEAKRKAAAATSSSSSSSGSTTSTVSTDIPAVSSGNFMWPASGRHSSEYGYRIHPITGAQKLHSGIDIANSTGTPIVASASGTVIRSHYSSSYGNVVYISHNINGQVYTTLYAHMEARHVSAGQSVSKGQQVGTLGSTGQSTGPHLHFEIHKGPWNGASSSVNPRNYLP